MLPKSAYVPVRMVRWQMSTMYRRVSLLAWGGDIC